MERISLRWLDKLKELISKENITPAKILIDFLIYGQEEENAFNERIEKDFKETEEWQ